MTADERTPDALVARLFEASLGMLDTISVYLGDRLGLYRTLAEHGPSTPAELASRAGIHERYAREWLEQQAASDILEVDDATASPDQRRFSLPPAYVAALTEPDSPYSITPLGRSIVACASVLPQLLEAFRSGGGVPWSAYGPDMIEAQGDFNRPWLVNEFGSRVLPTIPRVHRKLVAGARVADVACGVGWAGTSIARAFPGVRVDGFDLDESSIALANENARAAGVADRVSFRVRDVGEADAASYDAAVIIEAVHDMSDPVHVLRSVRRMLRPDGVLLIADERTADEFEAPAGELERLYYGFSVLTCLPAAMAERPTAAIGTVIRESTMRQLASEAGFSGFERLDEPALETLRFYVLTATAEA